MPRPENPNVVILTEQLGVSPDMARKLLRGDRQLTDEHKITLFGEYGGELDRLVTKYGLLAPITLEMLQTELQISTLADLAKLIRDQTSNELG